MTDIEINIAIAKKCGWRQKWQNVAGSSLLETKPIGNSWEVWIPPDSDVKSRYKFLTGEAVFPPNYCEDLNAMHEVEKTLSNKGKYSARMFYASHLGQLTQNDNGRGWKPLSNDDCFPICHATARQRAETFVKVELPEYRI